MSGRVPHRCLDLNCLSLSTAKLLPFLLLSHIPSVSSIFSTNLETISFQHHIIGAPCYTTGGIQLPVLPVVAQAEKD